MNCQKCGSTIPANADFCDNCGAIVQQSAVPARKPENMLTGFVGALIGAALGGASIVLLGQLGFVAALSGLILAVCTLKGYELLGGQLSVKGIIICIILMLVTPYLADRINWAIIILKSFPGEGITLGQAFAAVHVVIEDAGIMGEYIKNLLMLYGFAVLGAFGTLRNLFRK
ncbi:MAG: zinc ribbon domain-containing protein [Oscillospiraceae bacterium]|nr:zinc ribbon domain-containing protein [Oscillospiraceae bacterium]